MFAYCNNNPINYIDKTGTSMEYALQWAGTMWWLCGIDAVLPVGDIVYGVGILVLVIHALTITEEVALPEISFEVEKEEKKEKETETPNVEYPGDDPTVAPGEDYEWKGLEPVGGDKGTWMNNKTGEQLHPDLNHPQPTGPHWDYTNGLKPKIWWRIFPDGTIQLK